MDDDLTLENLPYQLNYGNNDIMDSTINYHDNLEENTQHENNTGNFAENHPAVENFGSNKYEEEALQIGLDTENLYPHDWNNNIIAQITLIHLKNEIKKGKDVNNAMHEIRGLNVREIITNIASKFKDIDAFVHWHNHNSEEIAVRHIIDELDKGRDIEEVIKSIISLNDDQISALGMGVDPNLFNWHRWLDHNQNLLRIQYLGIQKSNGRDVNDALNEIKDFNFYAIQALLLGLTVHEISEDDKWENIKISRERINHLRMSINSGQNIRDAMDDIRDLNQNQIKAFGMGFSKENLLDRSHHWEDDGRFENAVHYVEKQNAKGRDVNDAINDIIGLNFYQIQAFKLGLTRDQIIKSNHYWNHDTVGEETIEYIKREINELDISDGFRQRSAFEIFQYIEGLNNFQIQALNLGLTKEQLSICDWSDVDVSELIIDYISNGLRMNISATDSINKLIGMNLEEIQNFIENLSDQIQEFSEGEMEESLEGEEMEESSEGEMEEVHENYYNNRIGDEEKTNDIVKQLEDLGLSIDQINGHNWQDPIIKFYTLKYLNDVYDNGLDVVEAMNKVRGLNHSYQIIAIGYGLTLEDIEGHNWGNPDTQIRTFEYLKYAKDNRLNISEAFNKIKGVSTPGAIDVITELDLTKDQIYGHNWADIELSNETYEYLSSAKKEGADLTKAMNAIRGMDHETIRFANQYSIRAIKLGLSAEQAYSVLMDKVKFDKIENHIKNEKLKSAAKSVRSILEPKFGSFNIGSDIISAITTNLPENEHKKLFLVNKTTVEECKKTINSIQATDVKQLLEEKTQENHR